MPVNNHNSEDIRAALKVFLGNPGEHAQYSSRMKVILSAVSAQISAVFADLLPKENDEIIKDNGIISSNFKVSAPFMKDFLYGSENISPLLEEVFRAIRAYLSRYQNKAVCEKIYFFIHQVGALYQLASVFCSKDTKNEFIGKLEKVLSSYGDILENIQNFGEQMSMQSIAIASTNSREWEKLASELSLVVADKKMQGLENWLDNLFQSIDKANRAMVHEHKKQLGKQEKLTGMTQEAFLKLQTSIQSCRDGLGEESRKITEQLKVDPNQEKLVQRRDYGNYISRKLSELRISKVAKVDIEDLSRIRNAMQALLQDVSMNDSAFVAWENFSKNCQPILKTIDQLEVVSKKLKEDKTSRKKDLKEFVSFWNNNLGNIKQVLSVLFSAPENNQNSHAHKFKEKLCRMFVFAKEYGISIFKEEEFDNYPELQEIFQSDCFSLHEQAKLQSELLACLQVILKGRNSWKIVEENISRIGEILFLMYTKCGICPEKLIHKLEVFPGVHAVLQDDVSKFIQLFEKEGYKKSIPENADMTLKTIDSALKILAHKQKTSGGLSVSKEIIEEFFPSPFKHAGGWYEGMPPEVKEDYISDENVTLTRKKQAPSQDKYSAVPTRPKADVVDKIDTAPAETSQYQLDPGTLFEHGCIFITNLYVRHHFSNYSQQTESLQQELTASISEFDQFIARESNLSTKLEEKKNQHMDASSQFRVSAQSSLDKIVQIVSSLSLALDEIDKVGYLEAAKMSFLGRKEGKPLMQWIMEKSQGIHSKLEEIQKESKQLKREGKSLQETCKTTDERRDAVKENIYARVSTVGDKLAELRKKIISFDDISFHDDVVTEHLQKTKDRVEQANDNVNVKKTEVIAQCGQLVVPTIDTGKSRVDTQTEKLIKQHAVMKRRTNSSMKCIETLKEAIAKEIVKLHTKAVDKKYMASVVGPYSQEDADGNFDTVKKAYDENKISTLIENTEGNANKKNLLLQIDYFLKMYQDAEKYNIEGCYDKVKSENLPDYMRTFTGFFGKIKNLFKNFFGLKTDAEQMMEDSKASFDQILKKPLPSPVSIAAVAG